MIKSGYYERSLGVKSYFCALFTIDVAIFSTPTIKKIWNTEFGVHGDIKEYI